MEAQNQKESVFDVLNAVNVSEYIGVKNGLSYLSWANAWAEVKKKYPEATFKVYPQIVDDYGNTRFWHDDGKTGWVEVGVTINGQEYVETLAVMDFKNQSIPADKITSTDANKAMKRCLTKACALHGIGLYIYRKEDMPEEESKTIDIKNRIRELVANKCSLSDKAKQKTAELCKAAEKQANPDLDDDLISGNYNNIENIDILKNLEKQLMAVRK